MKTLGQEKRIFLVTSILCLFFSVLEIPSVLAAGNTSEDEEFKQMKEMEEQAKKIHDQSKSLQNNLEKMNAAGGNRMPENSDVQQGLAMTPEQQKMLMMKAEEIKNNLKKAKEAQNELDLD